MSPRFPAFCGKWGRSTSQFDHSSKHQRSCRTRGRRPGPLPSVRPGVVEVACLSPVVLANLKNVTCAGAALATEMRWWHTMESVNGQLVRFAGVLFVFREAFHVGFFAWLHLDRGLLFSCDRFLAKHTNTLLLSLFPHRRTPGRILGHRGVW